MCHLLARRRGVYAGREKEGGKETPAHTGEGEHDGVAMAAATTTVYLAALLNLI